MSRDPRERGATQVTTAASRGNLVRFGAELVEISERFYRLVLLCALVFVFA